MDLSSIAKYLIYIGIILLFVGSILFFLSKLGIGFPKLPGDIYIQRGNFTFYFPLATCIIISILLTMLFSIFAKK